MPGASGTLLLGTWDAGQSATNLPRLLLVFREIDVFKHFVIRKARGRREEADHLHLLVGEIFKNVYLPLGEEHCAAGLHRLNLAVDQHAPVPIQDVDDLLALGVRAVSYT